MLRITDQYFWNVVFLLFFLVLVIMGAIILETESRISFSELSLTDYILVTLASWRLVQLFSYDTVTKFFREQFMDVVKAGKGYSLEKPKVGPRRTLSDLVSNPWTFGLWVVASVLFFYLLTPYVVFPVILLAMSSVVSFLQIIVNLINSKTEQPKD